ncbi:GLPGLI family protein [Chitinophaga sp. SYP-B3965]|uniref:GLPGLI family protein n=1 Tax=Chitinophaga sp. SYP-B3965 TaxID=2663120 RepID=UPI00129A08E8|nr:GLPGLI family protein [Chitinophaga sp. SYP-B3965]MRG43757.1 GLPGLI family protein [Chitinophaga sp. SYP-B3965]
MKHFKTLLAAFVIFTTPLMAQDSTQGKVNYIVTMNLHANLKPDQLQYKDALPEFIDREIVFLFKGKHGLIKSIETASEGSEVEVKVKIGNEDGVTYVDMDAKKNLQLINVDGKQFLHKGDTKKVEDVKEVETGETKNILGYACKKVISKNGKDKTTYWYTTTLPILGGAFGIMSGKGLILELESPLFSFKAKSLQFEKIADADVLPPKGVKEAE